ncbi:hypothetical protein DM01DRAFT_1386166 [Hesseltinella vesiculosa]|uniref:BZIP domain-containing protein n=1 Tax=Hesseltinella vesiculosa TaxID=101127 RepID=A0A1X2G6L6_9FUNG|nr:hypothetical protein DM01DRAFT_1386166 [Hesseltinella vesiculosa]
MQQILAQNRHEKRKAQNRISQQQFRKRKEQHVKELEDRVKELESQLVDQTKDLKEENTQLKGTIKSMETELHTLRGAERAFRVAIEKLQASGTAISMDTLFPHSPAHSPASGPGHQVHTPNTFRTTSASPYQESAMFDDLPTSMDGSPHKDAASTISSLDYHTSSSSTLGVERLSPKIETMVAANDESRFEHKLDPRILAGEKTLTMEQVWERIQEHPRADDFDFSILCEEFKNMAVCSGTGPVVFEQDFDKAMDNLGENFMSM